MRAMIVGAGLGTRLAPLTDWRPKPVVPVRGLPLIAYTLEWLAQAGVTELVVNVHHLPERLVDDARAHCPPGLSLSFSHETELLHTGGAIRRVAGFLRESDPCLVVGGDMLVDLDLAALVARHRDAARDVTMALRDDPRADAFGTLGLDGAGGLRRVGTRLDLGGATHSGVYTWVNVLSARAFDAMPDREAFNHLDDWWLPAAREEPRRIGGELLGADACVWEPVGTPQEYLAVNLAPPRLSYMDVDARARAAGARIDGERVVGPGAVVPASAELRRVVVWDGERVPEDLRAHGGVFAAGAFHPVEGRS